MTSFTDDFDRADSSDLGDGWVEVSGDWSIVSSQLSPGSAGGTIILRASGAMASDDNYAQVTIAATVAASQGVWCRGNNNISSGYLWRNDGSTWNLFSVVGGSFSVIGTYVAAAVPGDVAKVQAVGSTIKGFVNGVERVSVTDTFVATGTSVGIRSESTGALRYDAFTGADVSAAVTLGVASSVETAQPLTATKTAALGTAMETDGAQPLVGAKTVTLATAVEQDTAQALGGAKTATLGVAAATEAAQPLTGFVTATLGTATAVETALPLTGSKTATLGTAVEVDTARPLTAQSTTVPSPERTFRIPAERRRRTVSAEHRTLTVTAEARTYTIQR
ncbi:hypothetical protein [Streptomyces liliifuscus]|uniref:Uncharacterized protein n=1 Tax=Streptomyces liliifuscus TaxID=2797636 RepID=A0A7T7L2G4_9ACTN|nr:hypothetical protein [Streptomyces liliifuscus]QQM45228.1 hypothetical protein JEQ17_41355 [Streptomyces liliifuscus]